ncbi:MAG: sn-glycerol-3-phosphate ABC transporter ATP-binding protein UgpC [Cellvibrionales bacterium]|nr:sn-glycerol-3-phosphate ABC transporter ATP-binding protein UgpC [Cellvibrionales bacterium]
MTAISLRQVEKKIGAERIIHPIDLQIQSGEFIVFVGPSGCGKSTLLRMLAGLEPVSHGEIYYDALNVTKMAARKRQVAMVFQSYALYPHMNVEQNLSFGLRMTGHSKQEITRRVGKAVDMLRLGDYLSRKPGQLSGGQCQRVAIGRALVQQPKIFLFDEPLSNLDADLRSAMRIEIARLHAELGTTMVYVTHDQVEAMTLADRIAILNAGRIEQIGTPDDIYKHPQNIFAAEFMGTPKINLLAGEVRQEDGLWFIAQDEPQNGIKIKLDPNLCRLSDGKKCTIAIRPEDIELVADSALKLKVEHMEKLGTNTHYFGKIGQQSLRLSAHRTAEITVGNELAIHIPAEKLHFFNRSGQRIPANRSKLPAP